MKTTKTAIIALVLGGLTATAANAGEHPYGGITFSGTFDIDGIGRVTDYTVWPETYPTQYHAKAVLADGQHLFAYSVPDDPQTMRYPLMDESLWFMPPMESDAVMTVSPVVATAQLWVNPDKTIGSDSNSGTSPSSPFETLQKAVSSASNNAKAYTVVYAAAGSYTNGTGCTSDQTAARVLIDRNVRIKGAGRGLSFLRGEKDTTSGTADDYGCGPNAVRCVQFSVFGATCVQGFTICDGRSDLSSSTAEKKKGGIVCKGPASQIVDCTVTNCYGYNGEASYFGAFLRCIVTGYLGGTVANLKIVCSVVRRSSNSGSVKAIDAAKVYQSTVTGDWAEGAGDNGAYGFSAATVATNCILGAGGRAVNSNGGVHGCLIWGGSGVNAVFWETNTRWGSKIADNKIPPLLYNVFADDPTPLSISPAIGAGTMYADYYKTYSPDVNGNPILFVGGRPTLGAVQTTVQTLVVPSGAPSGATLTVDGVSSLTNGVHEGDVVTLTISGATRPGGSFIVNGEKVAGPTYTFTAGPWDNTAIGNPFEITSVVFGGDWYVDAVNGDDSNTGFYPGKGHAKRTLCAVLTNGLFVANDTLHAAPGVYDEGASLNSLGWIRCPVPEDRHIVANEGPERTIIVGAASTDETSDANGCGPGAIRCVNVGKNASLEGFTLTGGRTDNSSASDAYKSGGAAYNNPTAIMKNCIISNNVAAGNSGAVRSGTLINCRIFDNACSVNGSIVRGAKLYGCIIDRNYGNQQLSECDYIYNCTIGSNCLNYARTDASWCIYYPTAGANLVANTICLARYGSAANRNIIATNSVFANWGDSAAQYTSLGGTSYVTNKGAAILDANYSLLPGCRDLIDGGDARFISDVYDGKDAYGGQRVYNGAIDIGAVETDWRPKYKADVAPAAGFAVTAASPEAYESGSTVRLPDGASLEVVWSRQSDSKATADVAATVVGAGTLSVFCNGTLVGTATESSPGIMSFRTATAESTITFSYSGAGYASVGNVSSAGEKGFLLIYR